MRVGLLSALASAKEALTSPEKMVVEILSDGLFYLAKVIQGLSDQGPKEWT